MSWCRGKRADQMAYRSRPAFTLVELLVVIAIIVTLASMSLLVLSGILADAKASRSKSQVTRIDSLIMSKWDQYPSRPLPLKISFPSSSNAVAGRDNARRARWLRLGAINELQRLEFPDRITDVLSAPGVDASTAPATVRAIRITPNQLSGSLFPSSNPQNLQPVLAQYPAISSAYLRRVQGIQISRDLDTTIPAANKRWSPSYQGAECLYMIIAEMSEDGKSALDFFAESEVGDVDNDGMLEILDAWGQPIEFLRWAPGVSDQPPVGFVGSNLSDVQFGSAVDAPNGRAGSPDPFDPFTIRFDAGADGSFGTGDEVPNFALRPFIFSAGRDKEYGIATDVISLNPVGPLDNTATGRLTYGALASNPYLWWNYSAERWQLGKYLDVSNRTYEDTIHNHQLTQ